VGPQLLPRGAGGKQLLTEHSQQRLLEGIELARPQPTAVGLALGRSGWDGNGAIRGVLRAPAQARSRQPPARRRRSISVPRWRRENAGGPEGRPEQGSGCPADAEVRQSMRPAHRTVGSADSRGALAPQKHCTDWILGGTGTGPPRSLHQRPEGVL
jgi:hypothetical protein